MADIFTSLAASGTATELTAILQVLRKYAHDRKEQYHSNRDCWYLDTKEFDELTQDRIVQLIDGGTIRSIIPGPYGIMRDPNSDFNCLFTDLADAAPMARFDIKIEGFDAGGNISSTALLREGKLYFNTDYRDYDSTDEVVQTDDQKGGKVLDVEGEENVLAGLAFVITGDLKKFKNQDAITIFIEERGGTVSSSVTKKTSFLINNAKRSKTAKNTKAKELGIPVITEKEFLEKFGLNYQPRKSQKGKLYESGYYDPIKHVFQPPRKLKKEPLTLQIIFECTDQTYPVLQIDLDVEDFMGLSCTPEMLLRCKSLDDLEQILLDSVTDHYSYVSNRDEHTDKWRIAEFKSLLTEKWKPMKQTLRSMENIEKIVLRRVDVRNKNRLLIWNRLFQPELMSLAKKAAICKPAQKAENVAAFEAYLDEQTIWYPWSETPGWPSRFCEYKEHAELDWRSLTDDAELFAKLIVTEDIPELDHGEEMTVVDFTTQTYHQSARYFPGW